MLIRWNSQKIGYWEEWTLSKHCSKRQKESIVSEMKLLLPIASSLPKFRVESIDLEYKLISIPTVKLYSLISMKLKHSEKLNPKINLILRLERVISIIYDHHLTIKIKSFSIQWTLFWHKRVFNEAFWSWLRVLTLSLKLIVDWGFVFFTFLVIL